MGESRNLGPPFLYAQGGMGGKQVCDHSVSVLQNLNCHKKIDELFSGKLYLIGIAAIVVAVIMVSIATGRNLLSRTYWYR